MNKRNYLKGKKVVLDNGKEGVIINALTKEETKNCLMSGQLIKVLLDDGSIEEHCYGYTILGMDLSVNKNSRAFDLVLLEELKLLKDIPANKFEKTVRRIMRQKTSIKLWSSDRTSEEWDGEKYQEINFMCCPMSHKANYFFCLKLDKNDTTITVLDGFLRAV